MNDFVQAHPWFFPAIFGGIAGALYGLTRWYIRAHYVCRRCHLIAVAIFPTVVFWLAAVLIAFWRDATWPATNDDWLSFVLICVLIEFFLLKALLMTRRMVGVVRLTASLIAANAMLAIIFSFQQALTLWPEFFFGKHLNAATWLIRIMEAVLCTALLWTIWELANVPPPAPLDQSEEE